MIEKGVVIQHKYAIPNIAEFYGRVDRESMFNACIGHRYYLLNWSNSESTQLYQYCIENLKRFSNLKYHETILNTYRKIDFRDEVFNLGNIRRLSDEMNNCVNLPSNKQKYKQLKFFIEKQKLSNSIRSASELLAMRIGVLKPIPLTRDDIVSLRAVIDFFISEYFSIYDCFIRLSINPVHDLGPSNNIGYYIHNYHLPTIPYIELWEILSKLGYLINPHCYVNRRKLIKENRLKVFIGNPSDMLFVQILSGINSTKLLCEDYRFIIERYKKESKNSRGEVPSENELSLLRQDFGIYLEFLANALEKLDGLIFAKIENEVYGITDKSLEKRLESVLQASIKTGGLGLDELISSIREYMKCFKNRKSLNDYLETFRKTKRRSPVHGDNIKKKLLDEAIKSVESIPFLVRLSKLYKNYDVRKLHEKLSDAAFGSDRYSGMLK